MYKYLIIILAFLLPNDVLPQCYSEIHCKHFLYGYPKGSPSTNDLIIRDCYALSSNDATKFADWVAYRIDKSSLAGEPRERNWRADPWLAPEETLEPDDYKSANEALGVDRGHQVPLASCKGSAEWETSNYLSNITPQKSKLNQGIWKNLEEKERKLADSIGAVYIITGPLYEKPMPPLPGADETHKIPSGYWKILLLPGKGNTLQAFAFIFNQETPTGGKISSYTVTIDEVEKRSGLDFLSELEDKEETRMESKTDTQLCKKLFD